VVDKRKSPRGSDSEDQLRAFLVEVATDPAALGRFVKDPEASMSEAGLAAEDQAVLRSGDPGTINARLASGPGAGAGGSMMLVVDVAGDDVSVRPLAQLPQLVFQQQPPLVLQQQPPLVLQQQPPLVLQQQPPLVIQQQPPLIQQRPPVIQPLQQPQLVFPVWTPPPPPPHFLWQHWPPPPPTHFMWQHWPPAGWQQPPTLPPIVPPNVVHVMVPPGPFTQ
jgi:hypothetical protein